jgi:hypothetical protein
MGLSVNMLANAWTGYWLVWEWTLHGMLCAWAGLGTVWSLAGLDIGCLVGLSVGCAWSGLGWLWTGLCIS